MEDMSKVIEFPHQSLIDPTRKTVGAIYNELQKNNASSFVEVGDLARELTTSLVDDLNDTIASRPFGNEEFYICINEKKDLQMKSSIIRRPYCMKYRPYPEDDTVVFHVNPVTNDVKFCWCLPHHTEMDNILLNPLLYNKDLVADIKAWKAYDMKHFGFDMVKQVKEIKGKMYRFPVAVPSKENRDYSIVQPKLAVKL